MKNTSSIKIERDCLSKLIRNERIKLGFSKLEFVNHCKGKIGKTTLVKMEYGKQDSYREDTIVELAKIFKISYEAFLNTLNKDVNEFNYEVEHYEGYSSAENGMNSLFNSPYSIHQPTIDDLMWIEMIEKKVYGNFIANSADKLNSWSSKNSLSITVMKDKNKKICGYLTLLPLKESIYKKFVAGDIFDKEINATDIYSKKEKAKIKYIYSESFLVIDSNFNINTIGMGVYLKYIPKLFSKMCDTSKNVTVFTIVGKRGDETLLNQLGFSKIFVPTKSRTKFDVFYIPLKMLSENLKSL